MSKCGANEALGALNEKTKEMADTLKDSVDLSKLQEFKDKAESIKGDIQDKLVSQIPKPKNLQEELEKVKGLKEGLAVGLVLGVGPHVHSDASSVNALVHYLGVAASARRSRPCSRSGPRRRRSGRC